MRWPRRGPSASWGSTRPSAAGWGGARAVPLGNTTKSQRLCKCWKPSTGKNLLPPARACGQNNPYQSGRGPPVRDVLTIILAGGRGTRLDPLTRHRAKPAVPFAGLYRIIDFTLSNCLNSKLRRVLILTQYKNRSLDRHISAGWSFLPRELGEYMEVLPPQQRIDEHWYKGTADAIYQNIYSIEKEDPRYVLILAGDHIYKMDYGDMMRAHLANGAYVTVGCIPVPRRDGNQFGVMHTD